MTDIQLVRTADHPQLLKRVAQLCADAFMDQVLYTSIWPSDRLRLRLMPWFFEVRKPAARPSFILYPCVLHRRHNLVPTGEFLLLLLLPATPASAAPVILPDRTLPKRWRRVAHGS